MKVLPLALRPVVQAAGAPEVNTWAVVVWPEGGDPRRVRVCLDLLDAERHADQLAAADGGLRVYLVVRTRSRITVYQRPTGVEVGTVMST